MRFDVLTLFPEIFSGYLTQSLLKLAIERGLGDIRLGLRPREVSIGDFVCNGGEVPAMVVIDTVIRHVPGVLGDEASVVEESHSEAPGRLEYPQYTRPRVFRGMPVPDVLLSGDHGAIAEWRRQQSDRRSRPPGEAARKETDDEE